MKEKIFTAALWLLWLATGIYGGIGFYWWANNEYYSLLSIEPGLNEFLALSTLVLYVAAPGLVKRAYPKNEH